ncbi:MAG: 4'-phosphopantetheinyl transferase superfamily protein [Clostridia bacterium]|nr:4'-phosphopantetheinyl transferase superfamily protein [Clostridia bacterium]
MSIYCGTDIIEVSRIKNAILENSKFKTNIFSESEIEDIEKSSNEDVKYQRYAGRFAAKEAIYKALSEVLVKEKLSPSFLSVEIINDLDYRRRPYVKVLDVTLQDIFNKYDIKIDLSISHVKECAVAMAVVNIEKE